MSNSWFIKFGRHVAFASILALSLGANAGDSLYGTVTDIKSPVLNVLDYGEGKYTIRLVGLDLPQDPQLLKQGTKVVSDLIKGKRVQFRFDYRNESGEMVGRLLTLYEEKFGRKDAGETLVRAGLAVRQPGFDYKCGCLKKAEIEAKEANRGVWAAKRGAR